MEEQAPAQNENPAPAPAPAEGTEKQKKQNRVLAFLYDILRGIGIGIAFIIPGFSGGSVAAILGVYEKIVGAIADFFKQFKKSFFTLLPIVLGMILGIAALIYPIQWGLHNYPIPTVTLFVGLALGGLPSVIEKLTGKRFNYKHALSLFIPLAVAVGLCFLPLAGDVDLFEMNAGGYFILIAIGFVGSCALVVPGISGSMLLLIFGYYNPVVELVTVYLLHGQSVGHCFLVLACLALGLVVGFFVISMLMKTLLKKCPHATFYAILGFIVGSIPAVYVSTLREAETFESASRLTALYASPWYWVVTVLFFLLGAALSLFLWWYSKKKAKR